MRLLNYKEDGHDILDEVHKVEESFKLNHDNVLADSVEVYTDPNKVGSVVEFTTAPDEAKPWETVVTLTNLNDLVGVENVYVSYKSQGDVVDADDYNCVNENVNTMTEFVTDKVSDILNNIKAVRTKPIGLYGVYGQKAVLFHSATEEQLEPLLDHLDLSFRLEYDIVHTDDITDDFDYSKYTLAITYRAFGVMNETQVNVIREMYESGINFIILYVPSFTPASLGQGDQRKLNTKYPSIFQTLEISHSMKYGRDLHNYRFYHPALRSLDAYRGVHYMVQSGLPNPLIDILGKYSENDSNNTIYLSSDAIGWISIPTSGDSQKFFHKYDAGTGNLVEEFGLLQILRKGDVTLLGNRRPATVVVLPVRESYFRTDYYFGQGPLIFANTFYYATMDYGEPEEVADLDIPLPEWLYTSLPFYAILDDEAENEYIIVLSTCPMTVRNSGTSLSFYSRYSNDRLANLGVYISKETGEVVRQTIPTNTYNSYSMTNRKIVASNYDVWDSSHSSIRQLHFKRKPYVELQKRINASFIQYNQRVLWFEEDSRLRVTVGEQSPYWFTRVRVDLDSSNSGNTIKTLEEFEQAVSVYNNVTGEELTMTGFVESSKYLTLEYQVEDPEILTDVEFHFKEQLHHADIEFDRTNGDVSKTIGMYRGYYTNNNNRELGSLVYTKYY